MENENEDYLIAKKLQQQFDKESLEISSGDEDVLIVDSVERDHLLAVRLQARYKGGSVDLLSDSDDDTSELNCSEYFIEELQVYVDSENNFEWKFIDVLPDIRAMFNKFDALFFQSRFKSKKIDIRWTDGMGNSCTNRNFNDDHGRYVIALNGPLLTLRPRIEIISIILHEMIHALLKTDGTKEPNSGHGANFRKIMTFLNNKLQTNISFNHKLHNISLPCKNQWYRCTGICHNYGPFFGIVRSIEGPPGLQNEWWKEHADSCGVDIVDTEEVPETSISTVAAEAFITHFERAIAFTRDAYEMQCPICQDRIKRKLFSNHIDGCKGFVRVVQWKKSTTGTIVQNGLLELKSTPGMGRPSSSIRKPSHFSDSTVSSSSSFANYQQAKRKRFG
uniref:Protein with SprT-like domain at the N terminus n=1 Tax=Anopheles christyi TaxID=43041 RepID=A0A182JT96_9DIPT